MASGTDLAAVREKYRAVTDRDLLGALKPHPISIVLAQVAMESAWGTSCFFAGKVEINKAENFQAWFTKIKKQQGLTPTVRSRVNQICHNNS